MLLCFSSFNDDFYLAFFCHKGGNAIAYPKGKMFFPRLYIHADHSRKMPVIGFVCRDDDVVVVKAIAKVIARQVMHLDAEAELGMMEINGLVVGIADGKVNMNCVAMVENGRFVMRGIRDVERCHQTACRLEMLGQETFKNDPVDLIVFR